MQRGFTDAVMQMQGPIISRGAEEFPAALADLQSQLDMRASALGMMGGSIGAAIALLVLAETGPAAGVAVDAAVLISPVSQLHPAVEAMGRVYGVEYPWSERSLEVAHRSDFLARADEIAATGAAVRLVVGADDDKEGFLLPAERLAAALADRAGDPGRTDVVVVEGMAHALAEEPGLEPAPQTAAAATVDRHAVQWFARHLEGPGAG
jgi:dienelactone hydrolase